MIYKDLVYGKIDIKEPVILELLKSKPVLRLKKITQHGPSIYNKYYKKRILTRFEHSLGVYIILKNLGASLEEQIAGLLHDVGHAVFSHAIDFLFDKEKHEYDKRHYKKLILDSEVSSILKKYNIKLDKVLNEKKFTLLEKPLPDLCADRIDYFLRDFSLFKKIDSQKILDSLATHNGQIIFKDNKAALYFANQYLKMNAIFWAHPFEELLYLIMTDVFKLSFKKGITSHKNLFLTEEDFLIVLKKANDSVINQKLKLIESLKRNQLIISNNRIPNGYSVKSKIRIVDPLVLENGKITRLSTLDLEYKNKANDFYKKHSKKRWIGYVSSEKLKIKS